MSQTPAPAAEPWIVENGRPQAEIVISEHAPRTTRLAADQLQSSVEKISGAKLKIVTQPAGDVPIRIFVGRSPYTDNLDIRLDDLKHGAYRIVSGDGWLVLVGDDTDFVPIEPWPRNNNDLVSGKMQRAWNEITGKDWGYPLSQLRKHYTGNTKLFGTSQEQRVDADGQVNVWGFDERGSFNAVCGFLRSLGVRWYMPGELGEVLPSMASIALPKIDQTVRPDFQVRRFNFRFGVHGRETAMWAMRLGIRDPYTLRVAHGMHKMTHTDAILKKHPQWFALYGNKRDNEPGKRLNHLCYSNEELFQETVQWARAQFDHFKFDSVSVMPPDAYISICQCPLCEGKDSPERGSRGRLSDHVWEFVNRVAKQVGKTHPDRQIVCCAYGANTDPPQNIDKLEKNVQVIIVGGRRPTNNRPEQREAIRELRKGWASKTDNPLMVFENYPFTARGFYLPAFVSRSIGESINATKGISKGEDIWLSVTQDFDTVDIGLNHFLVYFTARMYWGGPNQDVLAMLDEYCRLFYGPAATEMKAFFQYCEANWQDMETEKSKVDTALGLFDAAFAKADSESIYAKRLRFVDDFLDSLRSKSKQLARQRGPVPQLRLVWDAEQIVIDGKLDDDYWQKCPTASTGRLRELHTGRRPIFETTFQAGWGKHGDLYLAVRCQERPGEPLNIATTRGEDPAIWYGDVIEILLETDSHSYYQIAVNPSGARIDLDRGAAKSGWYRWDSQAKVATQVTDDQWTAEIRIPVTDDENDPLNQVIGRKPTSSLPWHINVCRQRVRQNGSEHSAFSPTGTKGFHDVMKFAHFFDGRSHRFPKAELEHDFLQAFRAGEELLRQGKHQSALLAFVKLAADQTATEYQKSAALEQAALCARNLKDLDRAAGLAEQIPIEAVSKTTHMQNLLAERRANQLIEQFSRQDLSQWPFWKAGEAYFARGRAYASENVGQEAEADLNEALELTSDNRIRLSILRTIGSNRENNLKDDDAALEAYRRIADATRSTGSADYYSGIQGAARILTRRGKFDEALAVLRRVNMEKLRGYWRGSMFRALGDTLTDAGKGDEAAAAYREVIQEPGANAADRKAAQKAMAISQQ